VEAIARDFDDEVWKGRAKKRGREGRWEARVTRDVTGSTGAGEDNSENGAPAVTQARLPQAVLAAGRETGTDEAGATAKGPDEGANALQPAAQRSRLMATGSAKTRSSASPARPADPPPAEAAAVLATGKRKRVAEAERGKEAKGVATTSGAAANAGGTTTSGVKRKKQKKKGMGHRQRQNKKGDKYAERRLRTGLLAGTFRG